MLLYKYQDGGGVYPQPTHNDSLALYYNALDKERFYRNNPLYKESPSSGTDFSNPEIRRKLYDDIPLSSTMEITPYQVGAFNVSDRFIGERRFGNVPNTGLRQAGDILNNDLNTYFHPEAPPIYIHPHIEPQGSSRYNDAEATMDVTDVPHYDPLAILNYNYLTPTLRRRRLARYGDEGFPKNYDIDGDVTQPVPPNPAKQPTQQLTRQPDEQPVKELTREQRYELYKKTPQYAENIRKQQELIDAGFDIELDGFWGKESQAAYEEFQSRIDRLPIKGPDLAPVPTKLLSTRPPVPSTRFRQYVDPYGGVNGNPTSRVMSAEQQREREKAHYRGLPEPEFIPELQEETTGRYLKWDNPKDALEMYQWYLNNGYTGEEEFLKERRPVPMSKDYIRGLPWILRRRTTN